jgi:hypothetical protein
MSDPDARLPPIRSEREHDQGAGSPARWYAWFCGVFLLLQGASTLAARLSPGFDHAFPMLLRATQMVPVHSVLHIATGLLAFAVVSLGAPSTWWFATLFGTFYAGLGLAGIATGHALGLGLKPFDHPFHIVLGLLGIAAAWSSRGQPGKEDFR